MKVPKEFIGEIVGGIRVGMRGLCFSDVNKIVNGTRRVFKAYDDERRIGGRGRRQFRV